MRTAKYTLLAVGLAFLIGGCGGEKKDGCDASTQMSKNKMVRIATDAVNMPFEFGAGTGVQGLDVDIGNEIAKDLGYDVKWVKMPFERLFEILKNCEAELVISALSITPERKKEFAVSEGYFSSAITIARKREDDEIKDLASLAGKRVGVQTGTTGQGFMEAHQTTAKAVITGYPTLDDALGALNRGEIDAVVGDEPILTYSIYESFQNLITTGVVLAEEQYGVFTRKEETQIADKVNATLGRLKKSGELEVLREKWFKSVMEQARDERKELERQAALKEAPKEITFNFIKTGGSFNMDRLDGFQLVLAGNKSYRSTPILTNGSRGKCTLSSVAPGEYRLSMDIFRLNTTVTIPKIPSRTVVFDMKVGSTITISQR